MCLLVDTVHLCNEMVYQILVLVPGPERIGLGKYTPVQSRVDRVMEAYRQSSKQYKQLIRLGTEDRLQEQGVRTRGDSTETRKYLYGFRNVSRISISLSAQLLSPDPAVYCTQHCTAEHCTHHQTSISVVLLGFSQPPRPGSTAHSSQYQHQPAALQHTLQ